MLPEERRKQLDGIVGQMTANRESDDSINFVVNDFKNKYGVEEPEERFSEKAAKVLDAIFGGGKVGEAIGTQIAKSKATPEEKKYITGPTKGEVFGSALQSAALFAPVGTVAKGITGGARAIGIAKGASALGKIGSGALAGEMFDVATNLQNGKTGKEALTPGLGALIGGGLPAVGVAKNVIVRMGERQAPRVINSLIKPLAKDFSYGKNPGRAIAEEGIIANDFDELLNGIRTSRERVGKEIGEMSAQFSTQPIIDISKTLSPLDDAIKTAVSQNNQGLVTRLNNSRRAIAEVLEPTMDDMGNIGIRSAGGRNLTNLTFKQVRNTLGEIGDMTQFTGNPSDDKLVNSALKGVYGKIKGESLKYARELNPQAAKQFEKLTEKYADLSSAEIATRYRDKIVERQALIGLTPQTAGIGAGIITAVATGGATLPSVVVGASAALLDKLASTPGFKTRLAFLLSKKTTNEVNYLFKKVPALKRFFSLKEGVSPGDVILGNRAEGVEKGITGYIKNPKLGLSIEDVSKRGDDLLQEARKYKSADEFVKAVDPRIDASRVGDANLVQWIKANEKSAGTGTTKDAMLRYIQKEKAIGAKGLVTTVQSAEGKQFFNSLVRDGYLKEVPPVEVAKRGYQYEYTSKVDSFKSQLTDIWNKANQKGSISPGALVAGAGATGLAVGAEKLNQKLSENNKTTYKRPEEPEIDTEAIRRGIVNAENRTATSTGENLYEVIGVTKDLGKYQANPKTLKDWSKAWLGKEYTAKEFLNDPEAQEKFFDEFLNVAKRLKLTPEESAVAWHMGWGELGTGDKSTRDKRFRDKLKENMASEAGKKYIKSFNQK